MMNLYDVFTLDKEMSKVSPRDAIAIRYTSNQFIGDPVSGQLNQVDNNAAAAMPGPALGVIAYDLKLLMAKRQQMNVLLKNLTITKF